MKSLHIGRYALFLLVFLILPLSFSGLPSAMEKQNNAEGQIIFDHAQLTIHSQSHQHIFHVEIAQSHEQRARGLMFRQEMPEKSGMLFLFDKMQMVTMWMENTYIPLDIIFLDRKGIIVHIARSTVPQSRDHIQSMVPVISVLEVNAGTARKLNVQIGDRVDFPFFVDDRKS